MRSEIIQNDLWVDNGKTLLDRVPLGDDESMFSLVSISESGEVINVPLTLHELQRLVIRGETGLRRAFNIKETRS